MNLWDMSDIRVTYYGFRSNSGLRNTLGIENAYLFELRKSPLASEAATREVTLT